MASLLSAYVARAAAQTWEWGRADCTLWPADWVREATGIDPAARIRGLYADGAGARRIIRAAGGLPALIGAEMKHHGFRGTTAPQAGDVGIVHVTDRKIIGAIRLPRWWVAFGASGLIGGDFEPVACWRILG